MLKVVQDVAVPSTGDVVLVCRALRFTAAVSVTHLLAVLRRSSGGVTLNRVVVAVFSHFFTTEM